MPALGCFGHVRYGNETQLLLILRSLIVSLNRQKIQRALETDAQIQMEQLVRELLSSSISRLKMRHQHLQTLQFSMCLSSYAEMWLPEYREIFEVFGDELAKRINRARQRQNRDLETDLGENLPFILASYGKVAFSHPKFFDTALSWSEENISLILVAAVGSWLLSFDDQNVEWSQTLKQLWTTVCEKTYEDPRGRSKTTKFISCNFM